MYGASDYATMEVEFGKREPDYSEHGMFGMDSRGELWVTDWWYKQCETDVAIKAFIRMVGLYKPHRWFNEGGLIDKAIAPTIRNEMRRNRRFTSIESLPSIGDKSMKVQAFHAMYSARAIHFPLRRKWTDHIIDQLCRFPGGKHDDAVDVCGLIGRGIDRMNDARLPSTEPRTIITPFTEAWLELGNLDKKPEPRYFS